MRPSISTDGCTILDQQDWPGTVTAEIIASPDPLDDIDRSKR